MSVYELASLFSNPPLSRRDDLNRFAEMFVVLALPEYEKSLLESGSDRQRLFELKSGGTDLCSMDATFREFYAYSTRLEFEEEPLYDYWIARFARLKGTGFDRPYFD